MKCPIDNSDLVMSDRQGIEIDYCPQCRGVWLDRGELDKIIERNAETSAALQQPAPQAAPASGYAQAPQQAPWGQPQYPGQGHYGHKPHKRRKSFLEEIFD